ncbi:MAG: hypothetical protein ACI4QT_07430, partial [Kiritimatiellia bacterium]
RNGSVLGRRASRPRGGSPPLRETNKPVRCSFLALIATIMVESGKSRSFSFCLAFIFFLLPFSCESENMGSSIADFSGISVSYTARIDP